MGLRWSIQVAKKKKKKKKSQNKQVQNKVRREEAASKQVLPFSSYTFRAELNSSLWDMHHWNCCLTWEDAKSLSSPLCSSSHWVPQSEYKAGGAFGAGSVYFVIKHWLGPNQLAYFQWVVLHSHCTMSKFPRTLTSLPHVCRHCGATPW